jgi:NADH dehydrogenase FAD-containing subunit
MIDTDDCLLLLLFVEIYGKRHPLEQKPFDPKKRTVVVLGSGWGAVSFLKSINTDDYNVVRIPIAAFPAEINVLLELEHETHRTRNHLYELLSVSIEHSHLTKNTHPLIW